MNPIRKLAGQTIWYGASNIGARFLNYLLTPLLSYLLHDPQAVKYYGDYSLLYAWIAVANIVFTYGFETGYFRFFNKKGTDKENIFQTTFGSLLISSVSLATIVIFLRNPINNALGLEGHGEYITWCALLISLDTLSAIPFAKLRQYERPRKYAFVKLSGIIINILFVIFFLVYLPGYLKAHPQSLLSYWYNHNTVVGFLILANLFQNLIVFLFLYGEWKSFRFKIDFSLWKKIWRYSWPIIFIGLAGMVNEVMDRQMLASFLPLPNDDARRIVAIYSVDYRLAILITLFIQAFKLAAEPFFFNEAQNENAPKTYAHVMTWFIITMAAAFLFTALYLDIWKFFIGPAYRSGLGIVPILLGANVCLGVYYNLSIWYKLTDKMLMGLYITLFGMAVTLLGNYFFIPRFGMYAAAWSTFLCYFLMMVSAYLIGQKYYPIPYQVKKAAFYFLMMIILFFIHVGLKGVTASFILRVTFATLLILSFIAVVVFKEREELKGLPVVGAWLKRK